MNKIRFIVLVLLCAATTTNAQDNKFGLGLKVGANYSNVYDERGQDFFADPKLGFAAGGFLSIPIARHIGVQPEFMFSQKGFEGRGALLGSPYSLTRTSNFIDVPLFLAIKPVRYISILVGPQFSYLMRQKDVFESGSATVSQEQVFKNDDIRKNILCIAGGIDATIKHIVLSARFGWDFQTNNSNGAATTPRYKNTWVQGTVGYLLY